MTLPLAGQILVAMPHVNNIMFEKSVIYVCGHDEYGSMGILLNRPMENMKLSSLASMLDIEHANETVNKDYVYNGGSVESGRGFVLHTTDYFSHESVPITADVAITASKDMISAIISNKGPKKSIVSLGYTEWKKGALEDEIQNNLWINVDPENKESIFESNSSIWEEIYLSSFGISPYQIHACGRA